MRIPFSCVPLSQLFSQNRIIQSLSPLQKKVALAVVICFSLLMVAFVACCRKFTKSNVQDGAFKKDAPQNGDPKNGIPKNEEPKNDIPPDEVPKNEEQPKNDTPPDEVKEIKPEDIPQNKDDANHLDVESVRYLSDEREKAITEELNALLGRGELQQAWKYYVKSIRSKNDENKDIDFARHWNVLLPPENLIRGILNTLPTTEAILSTMSREFLFHCALAYPELARRCVSEDKLWNCNLDQECIVDLCCKDGQTAKILMESGYAKYLLISNFGKKIMENALPLIAKDFHDNVMTIGKMENISCFLLMMYPFSVKEQIFENIIKLYHHVEIEKKSQDDEELWKKFGKLLKLVIGKCQLEGVQNNEGIKIYYHQFALKEIARDNLVNEEKIREYVQRICEGNFLIDANEFQNDDLDYLDDHEYIKAIDLIEIPDNLANDERL